MTDNWTDDDVRRVMGHALKEARRAAGYTQESLARKIGYSRAAVANAEIGNPEVSRAFWLSADHALRMAEALTFIYDQIWRRRNGMVSDVMTDLMMVSRHCHRCENDRRPVPRLRNGSALTVRDD